MDQLKGRVRGPSTQAPGTSPPAHPGSPQLRKGLRQVWEGTSNFRSQSRKQV